MSRLGALLLLLLAAAPAWGQALQTSPKGATPRGAPTSTATGVDHQGLDVNIVGGGGSGGTASNFGAAYPATGTAAGAKDGSGNMAPFLLDGTGYLEINCKAGCSGAAGDTTGTGTLNGANATGFVDIAGDNGVAVEFAAGTLAGSTVLAEVSTDAGTTWSAAIFADPTSGAASTSLSNPSSAQYGILWPIGGVSRVRVRVSVFGSGSVVANLRATASNPSQVLYGSDGSNLRALATTTAGVLKVDLSATAANGTALKTDSSATTQPVSGTVTSNQGGAPWTVKPDATVWTLTGTSANVAVTNTPTVTANAGSGTFTTADTNLELSQGSTTSGQKGPLSQGAVTTAAPTYTTGQTDPLSLTTAGALRTDGSGVTQPVSGTVTANAGSGTFTVSGTVTANAGTNLNTSALALDTSVNGLLASQGSTTAGEKGPLVQGAVTTAAPTYTTAQSDPLSLQTDGSLRTAVTNTVTVSGTVTTTPPANASTNLAQVGGNTVTTLATGEQKVGVEGLAASGAAKSGNPVQMGGVFNTTQPTVTTGQAVEAQATARGAVIVAPGVDGFAVSGTVTANAGTNLNTSALALDATVANPQSTAGTTSAPTKIGIVGGKTSDGTPQYQPLPLTNAGAAVKVDGTATTQPVSGTVTANQGGAPWTVKPDASVWTLTGTSANVAVTNTPAVSQSGTWTVQPGNTPNTTPWLTTIQQGGNPATVNASGQLSVNCAAGCTSGPADQSAFTAGTTGVTGSGGVYNDGLGAVAAGTLVEARVTAARAVHTSLRDSYGRELGAPASAAGQPAPAPLMVATVPLGIPLPSIYSLPTAKPRVMAAYQSPGVTDAAQVVAISPLPSLQCPITLAVNQTGSGQILAGVGGLKPYFCTLRWVSATAQSVALVTGTGATCGTGTTGVVGGTTAALGESYAANGGVSQPNDRITLAPPAGTKPGDNVCLLQSGAGQLSGVVTIGLY